MHIFKVSGFEMFCKRVRLFYAAGPGGVAGSRSVLGAAASKHWGLFCRQFWEGRRGLPSPSVCLSVRPVRGSAPAASGEELVPRGRLSLEHVGPCTVPSNVHFFKRDLNRLLEAGRREARPGSALSRALCFLPVY